jgi:hypothetical protein
LRPEKKPEKKRELANVPAKHALGLDPRSACTGFVGARAGVICDASPIREAAYRHKSAPPASGATVRIPRDHGHDLEIFDLGRSSGKAEQSPISIGRRLTPCDAFLPHTSDQFSGIFAPQKGGNEEFMAVEVPNKAVTIAGTESRTSSKARRHFPQPKVQSRGFIPPTGSKRVTFHRRLASIACVEERDRINC